MAADTLLVRHLQRQAYEPVWQAMQQFTDRRDAASCDECWLLEHEPVFTLGQAGQQNHILQNTAIPVVRTDRGGQVTYHGPGQLVMYWLVDLKRRQLGVRAFVGIMEQAVIDMLDALGIAAHLVDGAPGVYVDGAKIASLGLRVRKGCSYHGLAVNVSTDLSAFAAINPCGYPGLAMVNLNTLLPEDAALSVAATGERLLTAMAAVLDYPHLEHTTSLCHVKEMP